MQNKKLTYSLNLLDQAVVTVAESVVSVIAICLSITWLLFLILFNSEDQFEDILDNDTKQDESSCNCPAPKQEVEKPDCSKPSKNIRYEL